MSEVGTWVRRATAIKAMEAPERRLDRLDHEGASYQASHRRAATWPHRRSGFCNSRNATCHLIDTFGYCVKVAPRSTRLTR
ncbi:hypothetical protein ACL02O_29260 [Micromonospora sp. MS34]|uniref:hypothetical protein n=1 Tax=Micromonospora sp. MS34 TaxID=3385971 RepID=UPI0039A25D05